MKRDDIQNRSSAILKRIKSDDDLGQYVDASLPIPQPFGLKADIRLIILGQDPTVKRQDSRKNVKSVLNLDCSGSLRTYLGWVCGYLGLDLDQHVYATNLVKNFFTQDSTAVTGQTDGQVQCLRAQQNIGRIYCTTNSN